jgi:hypothetical protein
LAQRAGQPRVGCGELDAVDSGERRAPGKDALRVDQGVLDGPADRAAVILALAWDGNNVAGLAIRATPLAVVERDRGKTLALEAVGEWL